MTATAADLQALRLALAASWPRRVTDAATGVTTFFPGRGELRITARDREGHLVSVTDDGAAQVRLDGVAVDIRCHVTELRLAAVPAVEVR